MDTTNPKTTFSLTILPINKTTTFSMNYISISGHPSSNNYTIDSKTLITIIKTLNLPLLISGLKYFYFIKTRHKTLLLLRKRKSS